MIYPKWAWEIAAAAAESHADDINQARVEAERQMRRHPEFGQLMIALISGAVEHMVHQSRHNANVKAKRQAGAYGKPAKVKVGESPGVQAVYRSLYNLYIGKTRLGLIQGEDLVGLAEDEEALADGHEINAGLLRELAKIVPAGRRVEDAVPEKKLRAIYRKVEARVRAAR